MILDHNRRGQRRCFALLQAVLVFIGDLQVMTEKTVASDADLSVCRDRRSVVDEGVIAYRDMRSFMGHDLDRHDGADQANTSSEFYIAASPKMNAAVETYRKGYGGLSTHSHLSIEDCCGEMGIANHFEYFASGTHWMCSDKA